MVYKLWFYWIRNIELGTLEVYMHIKNDIQSFDIPES